MRGHLSSPREITLPLPGLFSHKGLVSAHFVPPGSERPPTPAGEVRTNCASRKGSSIWISANTGYAAGTPRPGGCLSCIATERNDGPGSPRSPRSLDPLIPRKVGSDSPRPRSGCPHVGRPSGGWEGVPHVSKKKKMNIYTPTHRWVYPTWTPDRGSDRAGGAGTTGPEERRERREGGERGTNPNGLASLRYPAPELPPPTPV